MVPRPALTPAKEPKLRSGLNRKGTAYLRLWELLIASLTKRRSVAWLLMGRRGGLARPVWPICNQIPACQCAAPQRAIVELGADRCQFWRGHGTLPVERADCAVSARDFPPQAIKRPNVRSVPRLALIKQRSADLERLSDVRRSARALVYRRRRLRPCVSQRWISSFVCRRMWPSSR
jgi:hypothetical protein